METIERADAVEITGALNLSAEERASLDMHSFLNIMNVLIAEFLLLGDLLGDEDAVRPAVDRVYDVAQSISDPEASLAHAREVEAHEAFANDVLAGLLAAHPGRREDPEVRQALDNIRSIFGILRVRAREILAYAQEPEAWETFSIDELAQRFTDVFTAIEKNSKGRYRIVYNIASQAADAYVIHFRIDGVDGGTITMPAVLQDVMRDLIANARKYTAPGGEITAGLVDDGTELRFVVEDTGRGIPAGEIERVVDFGYRASNVADRPTMGSGFGLTKAYFVTKQFGGRMWIRSREGEGTRVTIAIPRCAGG